MHFLRKLVLPGLAALAAMTAATSVSSATPVEVEREVLELHCGTETICAVLATGETAMEIFGITLSTCQTESIVDLNEDGTGYIHANPQDHPTDGNCTRIACNGVGENPEEAEFEILNAEETATNESEMSVRSCLDDVDNSNATGIHCTAPVAVTEPSSHLYHFELDHLCPSLVHLVGTFDLAHSWIEIEHL